MSTPRPSIPSSNDLKRSSALRVWYAYALDLETQLSAANAQLSAANATLAQRDAHIAELQALLDDVLNPASTTPPPPPVVAPAFGYGAHTMLAYDPAGPEARFAKAAGQTYAFAFSDVPFSSAFHPEGDRYAQRMQTFLAAALAEGLSIVPQMQHASSEAVADAFVRFLDHPAILRHNGKPVFAFWNWKPNRDGFVPGTDTAVEFARAKYGKPVEVWTTFDWWELMQPLHDDQGTWGFLDQLFAAHPQIDGLVHFAVGGNFVMTDPRKADSLILQNTNMVKACRVAGKTAVPGFACRYNTGTMSDADISRTLSAIKLLKPEFVALSTANDWNETSGINRAADQRFHDLIRSVLLTG